MANIGRPKRIIHRPIPVPQPKRRPVKPKETPIPLPAEWPISVPATRPNGA